jgi:hypothetical protein
MTDEHQAHPAIGKSEDGREAIGSAPQSSSSPTPEETP